MKNFKSHFKFTKIERSGIFFLLILIFLLIGVHVTLNLYLDDEEDSFKLDTKSQAIIDSLKKAARQKDSLKIFPFNPNYITDYKGYTLGMSSKEIDRLHSFREKNNFVNSIAEFQVVTKISDSLLEVISPYFKFPDWVNSSKKRKFKKVDKELEENYHVSNLNNVTAEDLRKVNGIGAVLSARIVKFRKRLGGFLINEQLYDVYGLEPHVADRVLKRFTVHNPPKVQKININTTNAQELSSLVYISWDLAQNIVSYRNANGNFTNLNELLNISGYPQNKNERIKLYLSI